MKHNGAQKYQTSITQSRRRAKNKLINKICKLANIEITNKTVALGYSCVMNTQDKSEPSSR